MSEAAAASGNICRTLNFLCFSSAERAATCLESAESQSVCRYVGSLNSTPRSIGKDDKFQLLVCLGARSVSESVIRKT